MGTESELLATLEYRNEEILSIFKEKKNQAKQKYLSIWTRYLSDKKQKSFDLFMKDHQDLEITTASDKEDIISELDNLIDNFLETNQKLPKNWPPNYYETLTSLYKCTEIDV